jgi:hypothetical protein
MQIQHRKILHLTYTVQTYSGALDIFKILHTQILTQILQFIFVMTNILAKVYMGAI